MHNNVGTNDSDLSVWGSEDIGQLSRWNAPASLYIGGLTVLRGSPLASGISHIADKDHSDNGDPDCICYPKQNLVYRNVGHSSYIESVGFNLRVEAKMLNSLTGDQLLNDTDRCTCCFGRNVL